MIYIVEDDSSIRELVAYTLGSQGMEAEGFECPSAFFKALETRVPDLVLLDIMLPETDGLSVLKKLKGTPAYSRLPVIMLTAKGSEYDTVLGLDSGADDYLVKPFAFEELLARIRVMIRRQSDSASDEMTLADLIVDAGKHLVTRGGKAVELSAKEFAVLEYLMRHQGQVLSREQIEQHVWDFDYEGGSNMVDVYIRYLRRKLDEGYEKKLIHTVRGAGYVMREQL